MNRCCLHKTFLLVLSCLFTLFFNDLQAQCNLSCQQAEVNVAINQDGMSEITSDIFVVGMTGPCPGNFTIQLFNAAGADVGNIATCDFVGMTLTARITHDDSGNFCQSTLNIQDNIGPVLTCPNDTLNCSASTLPIDVAAIIADDNCDVNPSLNFTETITNQVCSGDPFNRIITRTYNATDNNGNAGVNTCQQQIYVRAADLNDVVFPMNYDNIELPMIDCTAAYPTTDVTGVPTLFGEPLQAVCNVTADFSDQVLNICDGTYKILRTWTVWDDCTGATRTDMQLIKVGDGEGPTVTCPAPITVGTDGSDCSASIVLPTLVVSDNCSGTIDMKIFSSFGTFTTNGATIDNLPEDTHTFNYRFTDACGNETFCPYEVTVADDDGPTMICEQFIDVSIGTSGEGNVFAIDLDDGSGDNCCSDLTFEVKRQGEANSAYGATETFVCDDIGIQTVVLRATDCNGFSNTCMIQVEVEDKTAPLIACPNAITLECTEYPANTAVAGAPTNFDNCGVMTMTFEDVANLNDCEVGTVTRTFTISDAGGLSASCSQVITYEDTTPLDITFPEDMTLSSCNGMANTTVTGEPVVLGDCEMTSYSTSDATFILENGCGTKILRTHTILEMCSGVEYSDVQEIKIIDNEAPIFLEAAGALDMTFSCDEPFVIPAPPTAADACGDASLTLFSDITTNNGCSNGYTRTLTYEAEDVCGNTTLYAVNLSVTDTQAPAISCPSGISTFELGSCNRALVLPAATAIDNCSGNITITNDSPFADMSNEDASGTYGLGTTTITFTATDDCGNAANCQTEITVNDLAGPNMQCNSPLTVYLTLDTFAVLSIDSIDNGSFDNCSNPIALSIDRDTVDCADIVLSSLLVTLTGLDSEGNMNTCTSNIFVLDTLQVCENECPALTAGTIRRTNGEPLEEVVVSMQNPSGANFCTTSETGLYHFYHEFEENPCEIRPYSNDEPSVDVTGWDLILIKRHILNVEPFSSPYQYLAADVNNSGSISMADVVEAKRVILGIQTEFIHVPSWRFISANHVFEDDENPFEGEEPVEYLMTNPVWEEINLDFIGIKTGDVSGS